MRWSIPVMPPVFLITLLVSVALSAESAVPVLYHSPADDGALAASAIPVETAAPGVTLFLYLDGGALPTSTGTICQDGDGDELCGWEWMLYANGAATIDAFTPDPAQDLVFRATSGQVAAIGGDAVSGQSGPVRLGTLDLSVTSEGWSVTIGRGSVVDAAFSLVAITPGQIVATPEPTGGLWLGAGLMTALARRRRRRPPVRIATRRSTPLFGALLTLLCLTGPAFGQDADGDGVPDTTDNCAYTFNPGQEDTGGLLAAAADGVGDACQCGDVNGDGAVDLLDAATYQRGMANALPTLLGEDKCSVVGSRSDCDPNDAQRLREAIVGSTPGIAPVCQAAVPTPPALTRMAAAGDSITQGFGADCTCNNGFICLLCLLNDKPQFSWFSGTSLGNSFHDFYGGTASGIGAIRVSVSGAEMTGGLDSFTNQVDDILALSPLPDLVVVELGGNDVCNRGCVDPANCLDPLYDDATWTAAVEAGLDKLVGFGHLTSLAPGATVYLLGVPRVQDLHAAGLAKQTGTLQINCDVVRDDYDICEIATLDAPMNGEDLTTRIEGIAARIPRYNEILRDLALAYTTNSNGRNPNGIEIVSDYVNESIPSIGTTSFGAAEINGGDCFHPSLVGQSELAASAWFSTPR